MGLCRVGGQIHLLGGSALVFRVHNNTVAREARLARYSVFLTRHGPVHDEGCGANLGELEVGGGREPCVERVAKQCQLERRRRRLRHGL